MEIFALRTICIALTVLLETPLVSLYPMPSLLMCPSPIIKQKVYQVPSEAGGYYKHNEVILLSCKRSSIGKATCFNGEWIYDMRGCDQPDNRENFLYTMLMIQTLVDIFDKEEINEKPSYNEYGEYSEYKPHPEPYP